MIQEAIEIYFEGMELDGYPIPTPTACVERLEAAGHEYVIVSERHPGNYVAYVLDFLPECDVVGDSVDGVQQNSRGDITDFLAVKERNGEPATGPSAWAETMEIPHPNEVTA